MATDDFSNFDVLGAIGQPDPEKKLRGNVLAGYADANADEVARNRRLAQYVGLNPAIGQFVPEQVRTMAKTQELVDTTSTSPALRQKYTDPSFMSLAHDDAPALSKIERSVIEATRTMSQDRQGRTAGDLANDVFMTGLKGAMGLNQALLGIADIATGGYAGKLVQGLGIDFKAAQEAAASLYSTPQQQANQAVKEAQGFMDTMAAMLRNPSTIALAVGESLPQMVGGAAVGRQLLTLVPKLGPAFAAALGEGVLGAGSAAEQMRAEDSEGLLSARTTFAALGSGAGTALFGAAGGKVAARLGLDDIDTALVQRGLSASSAQAAKTGFVGAVTKAGIAEGVFEELPQSVQEQMWQNWGQGKPLTQGVGAAAAQGLLAGMAGGSAFQAVARAAERVGVLSREAVDAQLREEHLKELLSVAEQSKLAERSPEELQAFVDQAADGAKVRFDAAVLAETLQQSGIDVQAALPSVNLQELQEMAATGGEVAVPLGELVAGTRGTGIEKTILEHARLGDNTLSAAEARDVQGRLGDEMGAKLEAVLAQAQDQQLARESHDRVRQTVFDQLKAGNFTLTIKGRKVPLSEGTAGLYADYLAHFFTTMGVRHGMTSEQFYAANPLRVTDRLSQHLPGQGYNKDLPGAVTVEGYHFSMADRPVLTTSFFGTGLRGSARDEIMNHPDKRLAKRLSFYVDKGTGITPEDGVGGRAHRATLTNIYDSDADPLKLRSADARAFESKLLDAGYSGYLTRMPGTQPGQVILLGDQVVTPELLGAVSRIAPGERNVALPKAEAKWETIATMFVPSQLQARLERMQSNPSWAGYELRIEGNDIQARKLDGTALNQSLSSRLPSGKKADVDPLDTTAVIDWGVAIADESTLAKNVEAMQAYPNFPKLTGKGAKSVARNAEAIIQHMVDNLLWLHDHMDAAWRERARLWYDGARKTVEVWGKRYGISEMQGAAAIAVLSPQNGWFANVSQAERILDLVFGGRDLVWDDAMTAEAKRISADGVLDDKMLAAQGKTLGELLGDPDVAARWIRVYDQTHNNRAYRILTPEGGAAGFVQTNSGADATMMWKSYKTIAKAVSVLMDGRAENVHYQIGNEHKVRNFYNNIFDPKSPLGYATIDTHAVAAALLRPLASSDTEVDQAFGGTGSSSSTATGLNGTYPIYWEAYRRAAEARGLLPREMQSITWEAVRGLFEAAQKKSMKTSANEIWARFKKGEITQAQAQQEILALANDITPPSWTAVPFNDTPGRTYEGPAQQAVDSTPPGEVQTAAPLGKVMFEVAPDPNDTTLTAEWNALSPEQRLQISQDVAAKVVPQVLRELGTDGDFVMQIGGYEGATNPSMTLRVDRPELAIAAAKMLGFALSQDSMMVLTDTPVIGADPVGAVTIALPEGYGAEQIAALYDRLWELEHGGQKLVGGHTTADGFMSILNYSPLSTEELAGMIDAHLGGQFDIAVDEVYSAFPTKDDYGYASESKPEGGPPAGKPSASRRPNRLRGEATQLLREALDARAQQEGLNQGTLEQRADQTETPEFKRWSDGAPVVSAADSAKYAFQTGSPVVIEAYRGDRTDIAAFDLGMSSGGFFHTNKPVVAQEYAGVLPGTTEPPRGGVMQRNFVRMLNPLFVNARGASFNRVDTRAIPGFPDPISSTDTIGQWAKSQGYDGVIFKDLRDSISKPDGRNGIPSLVIAALDEYGVKSAIGNDGSFDTNDPSILSQGPRGALRAYIADTLNPDYEGYNPPDWGWVSDEARKLGLNTLADYAAGGGGLRPSVADALDMIDNADAYEQGPRGTFSPSTLELVLNPNADLSTFFHETGHFFLEVLAATGSQPGSAMAEDWAKVLKWFGLTNEQWAGMTLDQKRQYHERWAESVEQYVMEGKAPSAELRPLMRKFAAWLKSVYGSIKQFLAGRGAQYSGPGLGQGSRIDQTETPEFKRWFGDSKVVDASGKPLVVYHGGAKGITAFDKGKVGANFGYDKDGFFFTTERGNYPGTADNYAGPDGEVYSVYLSLQNPYTLEQFAADLGLTVNDLIVQEGSPQSPITVFDTDRDEIMRRARAGGHDGVAFNVDFGDGTSEGMFVALEPEQIKSATGNDGSFDADDPSILSQGGQPGQFNAPLNDDIRRVMDRLLATDEQIAQANETAGLTPDIDADGEAAERLNKRSMADLKWAVKAKDKVIAKLRRQAREIEKGIREQVTNEVNQMPEVLAAEQLKAAEAEHEADPVSADFNAAVIADANGFKSVDAMYRAIAAFGDKADVIDGITQQRMLEEHGDLIDDRAIEQAAIEAVHNEARARSLATELRTQGEMLNARTDTGETNARGAKVTVNALVEAAKAFGKQAVSRIPLADLKGAAWRFTQAERRAASRWQQATAAGKTEEAVQAKQDQMLQHAAAKAAIDAKDEAAKAFEFFKRVTKGSNEDVVAKGRDADLVNAARAVLAAYGVDVKTTRTAAEYLERIKENDPDTWAAIEPMVQQAMLNAQPLQSLTFQELQDLREQIDALWHLSKETRQMEVDGDKLDLQDAEDMLHARLVEIGIPDTMPGETRAVTEAEERGRMLQFAGALLARVEQWTERMDGKFNGPFLRLIFRPIKDATTAYKLAHIEYRQRFQALMDAVAPHMTKGTIEAPELGYTFGEGTNGIGHAELLHALLHTGNEGNKRKLLLGRGWATDMGDGTLDTTQWDAFINRLAQTGVLTQAHFDFVQGVWDLLDTTKPLAQKAHRDVYGRYFDEVAANEFIDPFGVLRRGGYVPAQADPRLVYDNKIAKQVEIENENATNMFPMPARGFTKARVEYNRPLILDLRTLPQHIDKVLLFSHLAVPTKAATRLLDRPGVAQALNRVQPAAIKGMLVPWLQRTAKQQVEAPFMNDGKLGRILTALRSRAGAAIMFANVSNTAQQITGLFSAGVKVRPGYLLRAAIDGVQRPRELAAQVAQASDYMRGRLDDSVSDMQHEMRLLLNDASLFERAQEWGKRHSYFLQAAFDNVLSPIVWTAAYNDALAQKMDEADAIRFADGTVRQTQGALSAEDVSRIEGGNAAVRLFTQFISYWNMLGQTNLTAFKNLMNDTGVPDKKARALYLVTMGFLLPVWVAEAIAVGFKGGPGDADGDGDEDTLVDWLAAALGMGTIKGLFAQIPFVGAVANTAVNRLNDNPADDRLSASPALSLVEAAAGVPADLYKLAQGEGDARKTVRDVGSLISLTTGLPVAPITRAVSYGAGVAEGKISPTGPVDAVRGVATGTPSEASKNR